MIPITLTDSQPLVEVAFQHRDGDKLQCAICPHYCVLSEGELGVCGGRKVIEDHLIAVNYGQICSLNLDPIEKKPLYHFYPGSEILSVGPNGCNLSCEWCASFRTTQKLAPTRVVSPEALADMVEAVDGIGAAYTYAEPLIWFEYVLDAGRILHEHSLVNIFISNGYINAEPLKKLLPIADAFNIDLKVNDDQCYKQFCGGCLEDVQRTIHIVYDAGKHLEITHLLVPGVSADLKKLEHLINWIAAIDTNIPLHLTRYFPANRYNEPPTDLKIMKEAYNMARSKLDWVYLGNVWTGDGEDSYCPYCGALLIKRVDLEVEIKGLEDKYCKKCGKELHFIMDVL